MARGDTTEVVRNLADEYEVCERTAWRWLAQMRADQSRDLLQEREHAAQCLACGNDLPAGATIRRRYCDGACRVRKHRRRKHAAQRRRRRSGT